MATNLAKLIINKRQHLRRRIETMKITADELDRRQRDHTGMSFETARTASDRLHRKIAEAERELQFLETHWEI